MLVNDGMNSPVVTVEVSDSMQHAVNLMHIHRIGMSPVLDATDLRG